MEILMENQTPYFGVGPLSHYKNMMAQLPMTHAQG